MSEPAIDIANAVVAALNGHSFSRPFEAARAYNAHRVYEGATTLQATVMPVKYESDVDTRRDDDERHRIGIALHQSVNSTANATIDPLVDLVREVHDFCRKQTFALARVMKRRTEPFDYAELKKKRWIGYVELELMLIYTPEEG